MWMSTERYLGFGVYDGIESRDAESMSLWRRNPRRDAVEQAIVDALRDVGAERITKVSGKGAPDLVFQFRNRVHAFEVKTSTGKRTDAQKKTLWPIVRSVEDVLRAIGAVR